MEYGWPSDMGACSRSSCVKSRGCARFLGNLIARWERRTRQAHIETVTPGLLCPVYMAATRREQESIRFLLRDLGDLRPPDTTLRVAPLAGNRVP